MTQSEPVSLEEIITSALSLCQSMPPNYRTVLATIQDCKNRFSRGTLHLAVMGLFKRGKSSFVNTLLGCDILPTSVVPVTSIPTTITYGSGARCVIKFFNKKPDLVIRESAKAISECLVSYVAEENNPLNRECVSEVVVEFPNTLLKNGTTLIDTPGFGSTFTHNTKTTLDILKKCDAVLFLLSADPPFTLTELEFLKEVRKAVPRIFFILNKIDLLSIDELKKIDSFVKSVLYKGMGFPADTHVFHVSAKMGKGLVGRPENDPGWRASGMDAIKTNIIEFLLKEKYFTLSQAVVGKLKEALSEINSMLNEERAELTAPVETSRQESDRIVSLITSVQKKIEKERGLMDVEIKAFNDFTEKTIEQQKGDIQTKTLDALRTVLENVNVEKSGLSHIVRAAFEQHAIALFNRNFSQIIFTLNKPIKKATLLHGGALFGLMEEIKKAVPLLSVTIPDPEALWDKLELSSETQWQLEGIQTAFQQIKLPAFFFSSKETRRRRYQECFSRAISEIVNRNIHLLSMHIREKVADTCKAFKKEIGGKLDELLTSAGQAMDEKKKALASLESSAGPRAQIIDKQKSEFKRVENMLQ